jgi:hypothetical protein
LTCDLLTKIDDKANKETASNRRLREQISVRLCCVFLFPLDSVLDLNCQKVFST